MRSHGQIVEPVPPDLVVDRAVQVGRNRGRAAEAGRERRNRLEGRRVIVLSALHERLDQLRVSRGERGPRTHAADVVGGDAEAAHLLERQVDPATSPILADVAEDVGELHGVAHSFGSLQNLRIVNAEDPREPEADDAGDAMGINPQIGHREIGFTPQVHPHPRHEVLCILEGDGRARHLLHDRVEQRQSRWRARVRPPGQFQPGVEHLGGVGAVTRSVCKVVRDPAEGIDPTHRRGVVVEEES